MVRQPPYRVKNHPVQRHDRTHRQDDDEQKVDVGDVLKLEPQILGNEAERRILGRSHFVSFISRPRTTMFILGVIG